MPDLLIELFSEEIPARMQARAAADLQRLVTDGVVEAGLTYAGARAFATPRRLALTVQGLTAQSPTTREERKGPRVDAPDKAIEGFCKSVGVSRGDLEVRDDKKGQVYFAILTREGRPAAQIVAEVLEAAIRNFPWPKSMRWGAGDLRWVRPLHSILCILSDEAGAEVVPLEVGGIVAGAVTRGHRFMAPEPFSVASFEDYAAKLKRANVLLDPEERAGQIWHDAGNAAFAQGLELVEDQGLLAEVAGLVEWPVVLMGEIDAAFRGLPPEVLKTSMKEHQKFFSVRNAAEGGQITHFVTVANRETADDGATILAGNRKVLSARLSDARFFWENDRRIAESGMGAWLETLENVTFHAKLGSQADRIARIAALARELAPVVGADADAAEQAAKLAKADLASEMVYEFPELQGVMGRYYAAMAGASAEDVAAAAQEHYAPLGPSDAVPTAPVSVAVALADKIDMLTGFWAIDEKPTGSKDPFALRRAALGVIRLVLDNGVRISLKDVTGKQSDFVVLDIVSNKHKADEQADALNAARKYLAKARATTNRNMTAISAAESAVRELEIDARNTVNEVTSALQNLKTLPVELISFLHDRLKIFLRDKGVPHDVIDACLAMPGADDLTLLVKRAEALAAFLKTEAGENLIQGFKRANNILTQAEEADGVEYSFGPDAKLAETDEERALFAALEREGAAISSAIEAEDFASAMRGMASLRQPIDGFFEAVQVNAQSQIVRRNRLNLLHLIRATCLQVADLTRLAG
ncbi:glycine--tRNA ligase subunit beta [Meridianimarinicoccus roseus]|uniref:Glycine--tRNA ligase beta subunit n=1 Tax=Meridianimarinicoccus roseus TaxID=2072018 RepID=A0A2V2LDP3_9RHOB|nr:glycine--tRNA ligase subunit beta [Meridianimarinicoccus roseus]PWR03525.1 glycine--tRNA ligase subunit beta [Meridianimarinicoccus roseus]